MNRVLTVEAMAACADRGHRWRRVSTWHGLGFTECATCGETRPTLRGPVGDLQAAPETVATAVSAVAAVAAVAAASRVETAPAATHDADATPIAPASNEVAKPDMAARAQGRGKVARNLEVLRLAADGVSRAEIGRQLGISWCRVQQILRAASAPAQPSAKKVANAERNREIVRRVAAGEARKDIAQDLGLCPARVTQILQEMEAARHAAAGGPGW